MYDLSGSTLSRVSGNGAQNLIEGDRGVNLDQLCDLARGDSSSFNSESTHTHVNVNEVITWLKPVKDARAEKFWKKYSSPPGFGVAFPPSRP